MRFRRKKSNAFEVPSIGRYLTLGDGTRAAVVFDFEGDAAPLPYAQVGSDGLIAGTWAAFMDQDNGSPGLLHVWDEGRRYVHVGASNISEVYQVAEQPGVLVVEIQTSAEGKIVMSGPPERVREALDFIGHGLA